MRIVALCLVIKQQMSLWIFMKICIEYGKIYLRKYHILNVIDNITRKNKMQISYNDREKLLRIFTLIDQGSSRVDCDRKSLVSIKYILKQLFDILGIKYKFIPLSKSKNTLNYYSQWPKHVY